MFHCSDTYVRRPQGAFDSCGSRIPFLRENCLRVTERKQRKQQIEELRLAVGDLVIVPGTRLPCRVRKINLNFKVFVDGRRESVDVSTLVKT